MGIKATEVALKLEDLSPYDFFPFASYVPGRTNGGETYKTYYKRHRTLAHAKTAIRAARGHEGEPKVFQWDVESEKWVEVELD